MCKWLVEDGNQNGRGFVPGVRHNTKIRKLFWLHDSGSKSDNRLNNYIELIDLHSP